MPTLCSSGSPPSHKTLHEIPEERACQHQGLASPAYTGNFPLNVGESAPADQQELHSCNLSLLLGPSGITLMHRVEVR